MSKSDVKAFWKSGPPGQRYGDQGEYKEFFQEISEKRYRRQPYISDFSLFSDHSGENVLEIGIGDGSDFQRWIEAGAIATGVDFSYESIKLSRKRMETFGFDKDNFNILMADAEHLPFQSSRFDVVYSWGTLHHTSDTRKALSEAYRVLKKGGILKMMVYGIPSWVGLMLQIRYGLMEGKFLYTQKEAMWNHLESPGTEGFTYEEMKNLLENVGFDKYNIERKLSPGDLLNIEFSDEYNSNIYNFIKKIYPSYIIKKWGQEFGHHQLVTAYKN